jgi:hypothetical protein
MIHLLIAPSGQDFAPTADNMQTFLGLPPFNRSLVDYAVKNAGAIELRAGPGALRITARPQLVCRTAVDALRQLCRSRRFGRIMRVALILLEPEADVAPLPRIFGSAARAIAALQARCIDVSVDSDWSTYAVSKLRLDDAKEPAHGAMHMAVAEWRLGRQCLTPEIEAGFLSAGSRANLVIVEPSEDRETVLIRQRRVAQHPWKRDWIVAATDFRTHPDQRYAGWVTATYNDVFASGRPRLDRVCAHVRCPETGARVMDYDRLILPWRRRDGSSAATLVSVVRAVKAG